MIGFLIYSKRRAAPLYIAGRRKSGTVFKNENRTSSAQKGIYFLCALRNAFDNDEDVYTKKCKDIINRALEKSFDFSFVLFFLLFGVVLRGVLMSGKKASKLKLIS